MTGARAWFSGWYDSSADTLLWETRNLGSDDNADECRGDNLYADCIVALLSGRK